MPRLTQAQKPSIRSAVLGIRSPDKHWRIASCNAAQFPAQPEMPILYQAKFNSGTPELLSSRGGPAPPSRIRVRPPASVVDRVTRLRGNHVRADDPAVGIIHLPVELLQEVFLYRLVVPPLARWHEHYAIATVDPPSITSPPQTFAYRRGLLMLVCRQWSDIIAGYPPFWMYVDISPFTTAEAIVSAIQRARPRPLQVSCIFSATYRGGWAPKPIHLGTSQQCEVVANSLASLARSPSLWSSLLLVVQDPAVMDAGLLALHRCGRQELLSDIQVVFTGYDCTTDTALRSLQSTFPPHALVSPVSESSSSFARRSLTALTLRRCRVAWDSMAALVPHLVDLNIDSVLDPIDIPAFVTLLSLSPVLSHLLIGGDFLRAPAVDLVAVPVLAPEAISVPSVRTLMLRQIFPRKLLTLLEHLDLPGIDKLGLDLRYKAHAIDAFLHADALSQLTVPTQSNPFIRVHTLYLRRADLQAPILFQPDPFFLPSFDAVTVLSLDFRELQIQYWVWLMEFTGLSPLDVQDLSRKPSTTQNERSKMLTIPTTPTEPCTVDAPINSKPRDGLFTATAGRQRLDELLRLAGRPPLELSPSDVDSDDDGPAQLNEVINEYHPVTDLERRDLGWLPLASESTWGDPVPSDWGAPTTGSWDGPTGGGWGGREAEIPPARGALSLVRTDVATIQTNMPAIRTVAIHVAGEDVAQIGWHFHSEVMLPFPALYDEAEVWPDIPDLTVMTWRLSPLAQEQLRGLQQIFAWFPQPNSIEESDRRVGLWARLQEAAVAETSSIDFDPVDALRRFMALAHDILPRTYTLDDHCDRKEEVWNIQVVAPGPVYTWAG
ncbi:hypothetical protein K466DRAFT_567386 [Polyporus arcularius HHB13444]|uniref:Uncharacterized protein n=1 Tax=Polyporus arcularius HHB13444 TaxID=1314778 RepID=A0A5C3P3D5_9APHY|nr:hypothetical protein K466DRAFT_567386 [Polyporus arcularius HHB13444]